MKGISKIYSIVICIVLYGGVSALCAGCATTSDTLIVRYQKTTADLRDRIAQRPSDCAARKELARLYYQFRDYASAAESLEGCSDKESVMLRAQAYAYAREYTRALELFEQAGESTDAAYLYAYAETLQQQNMFAKAVHMYNAIRGPLRAQAQKQARTIGVRVEDVLPEVTQKIIERKKEFIEAIDKEEAVVVYCNEDIAIQPDNTVVSTIHVIQKILKEKGKSLAEVELGYDSTDERVELEYARTITPEGKMVYAGKESIRDVSRYLNFPLYSNARAFIISMPSVEIGSYIEYKVAIYASRLITKDKCSYIYRLRERYPIAWADFSVSVPANRSLSFRFLNESYAQGARLAPFEKEDAQKKTYYWHFEDIAPLIAEHNMPPVSEINPAIFISSFKNWGEVYAWWYPLYRDKIVLNSELSAFVRTLIAGATDTAEVARRIYEFCTRQIRYVGVEYGTSGYEPHTAQEIFVNRYGDCKDKAILLVAMLREAGLSEAYPVLIPTREMYAADKDFAAVHFNHAIACVRLGSSLVFMDATASTTAFGDMPFDDQDRDVLVITDTGYEFTRTPLLTANSITYHTRIDINEQEHARITRTVSSTGRYSAARRYYFQNTHPQQIKDSITSRMASLSPFAKLLEYRIENVEDFTKEPELTYTFDAGQLLNPAGNLRVLAALDDVDIDTSFMAKDTRVFPVEFDGIYTIESSVEVALPDTLTVKFLPQGTTIATPWFMFASTYDVAQNTVRMTRQFRIKERRISLPEYGEFKQRMEQALYALREEVILEKK